MSDWISEDLFQMLHTVSSSANKWWDEDSVEMQWNGGWGGGGALFTNQNADEAWVWAVEYKLEWRVFMFSIYKCSIFGQRLYTLEAGPNETKKVKTQDLFFLNHWASHLRWNGRYISVSERHA